MKNRFKLTAIAWCLGMVLSPLANVVLADDIDIYDNNPPAGEKPNVLIILDNSSNWNASFPETTACTASAKDATKFCSERETLKTVISSLGDNVNVGLMMFAEAKAKQNGGYVRYAIREMNDGNKSKLADMIGSFERQSTDNDEGPSSQPYGKAMFEAYKYFGGGTGVTGTSTGFGLTAFAGAQSDASPSRRDYAGNTVTRTVGDLPGHALSSMSDRVYKSPVSSECAQNYIIFISNGNPSDSNSDKSTGGDGGNPNASTLLSNVDGSTQPVVDKNNNTIHGSLADEYARFLYGTDINGNVAGTQNVITYTIGVYALQNNGSISNTDQDMIKLMKSTANQGGGKYFAGTDAASIKAALDSIFSEILAANNVFASASLPVNSGVQGTYLNQVYMGVFRPNEAAGPLWLGNLKQYQFQYDDVTGKLYLADAFGLQVDSSTTGFVVPNAVSFWTTDSSFWTFKESYFTVGGNGTSSSCGVTNGGPASDCPDGPWVEKGGAAQRLRTIYAGTNVSNSPLNRPIYICNASGGVCNAGSTLSTTIASLDCSSSTLRTALGVADQAECQSLTRWIRGEDNKNGGENAPYDTSTTDVRPSIHADVLHSQPAVIDYGSSIGIWAFYGSNDGIFHATKGGQDQCTSANSVLMPPSANTCPGTEQWGFIPPEFLDQRLKRLRDQSPVINMPSVPGDSNNKPYFMDGPVSAYRSGSTVYIFTVMRRGGRSVYAFNVSNPTAPILLWHRSNLDAGFSELGETWSSPVVVKLGNCASSINAVVLGAGYDAPVEDGVAGASQTMGRGIFVLNLTDGTIIKSFTHATNSELQNSIPGNITPLDIDHDHFIDRFYAADTGGNIWRIKYDPTNATNPWSLFKLASLGGTGVNNRKFLFEPDVVVYNKNTSPYEYAILIGSGDREKPTASTTINRFYMLIDDGTDTLIDPSANSNILADASSSDVTLGANQKGWFITLNTGEKVTGHSVTVAGTTVFGTNKPVAATCQGSLGEARRYAIKFREAEAAGVLANTSANARFQIAVGGGFLPSPVAGKVQVKKADNTMETHVFIMDNPANPGGVMKLPIELDPYRNRIYWYKQNVD